MDLVPEIDVKQTKKNARKILSQYRKWERIAGKSLIDIRSPLISDMPRTLGTSVNRVQDGIVERINAEIERDAIIRALGLLSQISREILAMAYCEPDRASNFEIGQALGYSVAYLKDLKGIALLEFAEAYKHGQLMTYK